MFFIIASKLSKSHMVKFSKNQIPLQNSSILSITLNEGLVMPCANCTMMGFAINSVLIPSCFIICKVMNKFVTPKSKKQPTSLSFILQFNFNKLEASFLCAPISATKFLWRINLPWAMHSLTLRWLGAVFRSPNVRCYHN